MAKKKSSSLFALQILKTEVLHRDIFTDSAEAVAAFEDAKKQLTPEDADKRVVVLHQHVEGQALVIRVLVPSLAKNSER